MNVSRTRSRRPESGIRINLTAIVKPAQNEYTNSYSATWWVIIEKANATNVHILSGKHQQHRAVTFSEHSLTSKMKHFEKIVDDFYLYKTVIFFCLQNGASYMFDRILNKSLQGLLSLHDWYSGINYFAVNGREKNELSIVYLSHFVL